MKNTYNFNGILVTTKLSIEEYLTRYNRLDTLRVLCEGYEEGEGFKIYTKARNAENNTADFTGIIRLTSTEKDFLSYILNDCIYLDDDEVEVLKFYIG